MGFPILSHQRQNFTFKAAARLLTGKTDKIPKSWEKGEVMPTIGLCQINWDLNWDHAESLAESDSQSSYALLPYSVGLLQAYASTHARRANDIIWRTPVFSLSQASKVKRNAVFASDRSVLLPFPFSSAP